MQRRTKQSSHWWLFGCWYPSSKKFDFGALGDIAVSWYKSWVCCLPDIEESIKIGLSCTLLVSRMLQLSHITCVFFDRIHLLADPIGLATEKGLGSLVETNGVSICFTATSMRHNGNCSEGSSLSSTRAFRVTVTETHKRDHDGDHDGRAILLFHVEDGC